MTCNTVTYTGLPTRSTIADTDGIIVVVDGVAQKSTVAALLENAANNGVVTLPFNPSSTHQVPAEKLLKTVVIITTTTNTIRIGTTANGNQIDEQEVVAGTPYVLSLDAYFSTTTTLHFTGNATVKLYLL
jgi:hypothetical protein